MIYHGIIPRGAVNQNRFGGRGMYFASDKTQFINNTIQACVLNEIIRLEHGSELILDADFLQYFVFLSNIFTGTLTTDGI